MTAEPCGCQLATNPCHPELCKFGATRARTHRHVEAALCESVDRVGGASDVERFVPEMYLRIEGSAATKIKKAVMDVVVQFPGRAAPMLVDVSVRSPFAARYSSSTKPGHASAVGEREKWRRYGDAVIPLVFESRGRLGQQSLEGLESLVSAAASAKLCNPACLSTWRARLERAVLYSTADAYLRAAGAAATAAALK